MYLLEVFLGGPVHLQNIIDSLSLSILSAPFIWLLIVRPFQHLALAEKSRTEQIEAAAALAEQKDFAESLSARLTPFRRLSSIPIAGW